jgi:hypothetical protein
VFLVVHDCSQSARLVVARVGVNKNPGPDAVIRIYDDAGNAIETHEHKGDFKEPSNGACPQWPAAVKSGP